MSEHLWEVANADEDLVNKIQTEGNVTRPTALVLARLGVAPDKIQEFLRPQLSTLSDPYDLKGTKEAAERIWKAIKSGEKILIHGDYDTDGITATALMSWVLKSNGANVSCFLPHRFDDGYGLTPESLEKAGTENFSLLITVDCGITSHEAMAATREMGIDVVITDHHEPGCEPLQASIIVDPKVSSDDPAMRDLAGVGVAFKVCHAFLKYGRMNNLGGFETNLKDVLDLAALGTVADIVPLLGENRCVVRHGLKILSRQHRPGIRALCEVSQVNEGVASSDITYRLAPRLNAAGRIGDPNETLRLLEAASIVEAYPLAQNLDRYNRERQQIEELALQSAEQQISSRINLNTDRSIVVWNEEWHQGVIGIVASRLVRKYHRPSIVLTKDSCGLLGGSGRSIRRLNLVSVLENCKEYLVRFGGHAMAAGLALQPQNLEPFIEAFEVEVRKVLGHEAMLPVLEICGNIRLDELTGDFFEELKQLAPFGHSNKEPVFVTREVYPDRLLPAGARHSRGMVRDISGAGIEFIAFGKRPVDLPEPPWDLAYTPQINTFGGQSTPQLRIVDIQPA